LPGIMRQCGLSAAKKKRCRHSAPTAGGVR
jgi:hypothetical protein